MGTVEWWDCFPCNLPFGFIGAANQRRVPLMYLGRGVAPARPPSGEQSGGKTRLCRGSYSEGAESGSGLTFTASPHVPRSLRIIIQQPGGRGASRGPLRQARRPGGGGLGDDIIPAELARAAGGTLLASVLYHFAKLFYKPTAAEPSYQSLRPFLFHFITVELADEHT